MEDGTIRVAPTNETFTGEVDGKPVTVPRAGHPNITEGQPARLGGELTYDKANDAWAVDNNSGRYGNRGEATQGNLDAATELFRQTGTEGNFKSGQLK